MQFLCTTHNTKKLTQDEENKGDNFLANYHFDEKVVMLSLAAPSHGRHESSVDHSPFKIRFEIVLYCGPNQPKQFNLEASCNRNQAFLKKKKKK